MSFIPPPSPDPDAYHPAQPAEGHPPAAFSPLPAPPLLRRFPLHPSFGWAVLWCVAMLLLTQVPGAMVAGVYIVAILILNPEAFNAAGDVGVGGLMANPNVQVALGIGIGAA